MLPAERRWTVIIGIWILGVSVCTFYSAHYSPRMLGAQEPKHKLVTALDEGVYVIDVRDAMNDTRLGWAPLLVQFKKDHPDRRVVAIAPASVSGGRGTMNSIVILTEPK